MEFSECSEQNIMELITLILTPNAYLELQYPMDFVRGSNMVEISGKNRHDSQHQSVLSRSNMAESTTKTERERERAYRQPKKKKRNTIRGMGSNS